MRLPKSGSRLLATAALIVGAAVVLTSGSAEACASCACGDPTLTALGADIPFEGRLRAYSGLRYWTAGSKEGELREARMDVAATWSPNAWLVVGVDLPLQRRELTGVSSSTSGTGAGDLQLSARAVVFRDRSFSPQHLMHVFGGLELPTATLVRGEGGEAAPLDAQLGSGSWDPLVGAGYSWFADQWSGSVDLRFRLSTPGFEGHREGNATTGAAAVQYQPWSRLGFRLGVEAKYEGSASGEPTNAQDEASNFYALHVHAHSPLSSDGGAEHVGAGSLVTFVSPAVVAAISGDFLLNLAVHLPVVDATPHTTGLVLQLGATLDF